MVERRQEHDPDRRFERVQVIGEQTCTRHGVIARNRSGYRYPFGRRWCLRHCQLRGSPARAERVVKEIRNAGGNAEAVGADLSTVQGINTLIASIDQVFGGSFGGRLDILVNNAGTVDFGPFMESAEDSYDKHFNLNVRPLVALSKDAARRMLSQKWGRIINIGSIHGESATIPGVTMYVATKFAVHGFTRGLSRELGGTGITVNAVQPGFIDTELSPADGHTEEMKKLTSVGRFGRVEEIASAVAFLAHPESAFINGENLTVDGGWSA